MKSRTATFDAQNLQTARVILQDEAKYGTLVVQWARLVVGKAPVDAATERAGRLRPEGGIGS